MNTQSTQLGPGHKPVAVVRAASLQGLPSLCMIHSWHLVLQNAPNDVACCSLQWITVQLS